MGPVNRSKSKKRALVNKKEGDPERERPPPPPPPPASLVKLLQKDSSVLRYFQSLQENLDYDVLKWKSRARFQEQQARELAAKLEERNQTMEVVETVPIEMSQQNPTNPISSHPPEQDKPPATLPIETDTKEPPRSEKPKEESDFELEFSSSEDDEKQDHTPTLQIQNNVPSFGIHKKKTRSMDLSSSSSSSASSVSSTLSAMDWKDSFNHHRALGEKTACQRMIPLPSRGLRDDILGKLAKVQSSLLDIGIPLVVDTSPDGTSTTVDEEGSDMDESANVVKEASASTSSLCRRSDQDVIMDILTFLRDLARINISTDQTRYSPFMAPDFLPCFESTGSSDTMRVDESMIPHPAIAGMEIVMKAFCVMDAFCSTLDQLDADPTFVPNEKEFVLLLGMRHRHEMIANLILSLEGEMVECWPVSDRSIRIQSTATHVNMDTMIEGDKEATSDEHAPNGTFHAKSFVRLVALAERCMHAKLAIGVLLFRGDHHRAFHLFWSCFLATMPSILIEDYPKLQPVQSLCVVDILLFTNKPTLQGIQGLPGSSLGEWIVSTDSDVSFVSGLQLMMTATASIFELRNSSDLDCRVVDISRIELAAFQRLQAKLKPLSDAIPWPSPSSLRFPNDFVDSAKELVLEGGQHSSFVSALALVLNGNVAFINQEIEKCLQGDSDRSVDLLSCVKARCQWEIRQMDKYRAIVALPTTVTVNPEEHKEIKAIAQSILLSITSKTPVDLLPDVVKGAIRCLKELGDAESLYRLCLWLTEAIPDKHSFDSQLCKVWDEADIASDFIAVRVINLKRRPDRYAAFISQALAQKLLVLKGVVPLRTDVSTGSNIFFGCDAVDGKESNAAQDVVQLLQDFAGGSPTDLDRLVQPKWVPGDLRPFDSEAPETDDLVTVSNTEKACALSHVGAWHGVIRTLDPVGASPGPMLPHRKVLISGFARGPPLNPKSDDMQPTPVCVILEDDAILVDRFVDRLEVLLEELPRDFHFCSIGYGRPKKAPLVPFSTHLSIPTAIWYLTGYILSLEGARHLVNKLPVRGPVDSWIGLAIFSNWDNTIGHGLGVGVSSKVSNETHVSLKSLRAILRFRAFAATIPLCSQRVGNVPGGAARSGWRHRDTDIEYSGSNTR